MSWLREVDQWLCHEVLPHQHAYRALARRLTGSSEVAHDIVQDVYTELLSGEGWRNAINPKPFVLRIVYCRSVNWVRRQRIIPMYQLPSYETLSFSDYAPDAFEKFAGREELAIVLEILNAMPARCRQAVMLRRVEDLTPREIAARLGIDIVTVRRHLSRALRIITKELAMRGAPRRGEDTSSLESNRSKFE